MSLVSHSCKFSNIQVYIRNNENNISDEGGYVCFLAGWKYKEGQKYSKIWKKKITANYFIPWKLLDSNIKGSKVDSSVLSECSK